MSTRKKEQRAAGKAVASQVEPFACSSETHIEPGDLVRIQGRERPVYLHPSTAFWFVPSPPGDELLRHWGQRASRQAFGSRAAPQPDELSVGRSLDFQRLLHLVQPPAVPPYRGRQSLKLEALRELWFHLSNGCNLHCRHCLFACSPEPSRSLPLERVQKLVQEACGLGCRLVSLTGGEPLIYPGFADLLRWLLDHRDLQVAVLTNGLLLPRLLDEIGTVDRNRLHFQVSLDGPAPVHEALRGKGTFAATASSLRLLVEAGIPCSIAMAVNSESVGAMADLIRVARRLGVTLVHFLWHFQRGKGTAIQPLALERLKDCFRTAARMARQLGVTIDNLEAVRAQVFSPPGTRFDLSNAAWESLAVGPDGELYPSPALVGVDRLRAGSSVDGIEPVWRKSALLKRIRQASLLEVAEMASDPWRFIIGGGDLDHCCLRGDGAAGLLGNDPYLPLYRDMALMAIEEEARRLPLPPHPGLVLRMGDISSDCPSTEEVNFTHCNCLLSLGAEGKRGLVRRFYSQRALVEDKTILNPLFPEKDKLEFIPAEARARSYGCGSPVADAALKPGEVVIDLGCGTGVECFLAARQVGGRGRVIGVDMTGAMLDIAVRSQKAVRVELGYANTAFVRGYLEAVPLAAGTADVVVSNCVVNLSHNKRRVFQGIFRLLKPGGRLLVSDVVAETEPPPAIRSNRQLAGECIGGALVQDYLFTMLREMGFVSARIIKRFPYRTVQAQRFYALTFIAWRPLQERRQQRQKVLYGGPFRAVLTDAGTLLPRGQAIWLEPEAGLEPAELGQAGLLALDSGSGEATNLEVASRCGCVAEPGRGRKSSDWVVPQTGCLICGAPLVYQTLEEERTCARCGRRYKANAVCEKGHFVCDLCHIRDPVEVIRRLCTCTRETDMLRLLLEIRSQGQLPMHGPEHHALVPGIILATYRNLGGPIGEKEILQGIKRGGLIPGGACAFLGCCGAALGVGVAFSIVLAATPLTAGPRQKVQHLVGQILGRLAQLKAARCCQRECYLALVEAARHSAAMLPLRLRAEASFECGQHGRNRECIKAACSLYPRGAGASLGLRLEDHRSRRR